MSERMTALKWLALAVLIRSWWEQAQTINQLQKGKP